MYTLLFRIIKSLKNNLKKYIYIVYDKAVFIEKLICKKTLILIDPFHLHLATARTQYIIYTLNLKRRRERTIKPQ